MFQKPETALDRSGSSSSKLDGVCTLLQARHMVAFGLMCWPVMAWPAWETNSSTDEMTSEKVQVATATSTNTVEFGFPYDSPQKGFLQLRIHPRHGNSVILSLNKAQFLCQMDGCKVLVRFDGGEAKEYQASAPADHSTDALFIRGFDAFVSDVSKAKWVKIEAQFYQNGSRVFTFDVSNLPTIFSEDRVKTQRRKELERKQKEEEDVQAESQFNTLIWPTEGRLMYGFGGGVNQKGIGITGKVGQAIVASFAGKVVYSGSELRGYGKMIILKHNISYQTIYANNSDISVKVGDQVHQGQQIGHMGVTDEGVPLLHFEVRRLGKPVDPLISLPKP
jgi:murein DD-endopeptidase MepM/ murein hydrolase activator NlpD